jgi:hypothetical protein
MFARAISNWLLLEWCCECAARAKRNQQGRKMHDFGQLKPIEMKVKKQETIAS